MIVQPVAPPRFILDGYNDGNGQGAELAGVLLGCDDPANQDEADNPVSKVPAVGLMAGPVMKMLRRSPGSSSKCFLQVRRTTW